MLARRLAVVLCAIVLTFAAPAAQSRVVELNDAGWKALRSGYNDRAAALFAEALSLKPDDPVLLFGSAAAATGNGKQTEAIALLERALEIQPNLTPASQLLGRIAYAEGDVDLAVRTYEQALKYAPDNPALSHELAELRRETEVHKSFDERRYDQFRVLFEGREEQALARRATEIFHVAFRRICEKLGEFPAATIVAVLYTEHEFRDITRGPAWSAGLYDGRIRVPVAGALDKPDLFERVLTHELAHAVVTNIAPRGVPAWLNEGLAQFFEGANAYKAHDRMKQAGRYIPLSALEGGFSSLNRYDAVIAYDESLLAAGVILDRPGFAWSRLLHELAESRSAEATLASFGLPYADLEQAFKR